MTIPAVPIAGAVAAGSTVLAAAQTHPSASSMLLATAAVLAAVTAIVKFLHLGELLRGTRSFLQDWNGEKARPGKDAVPGFPERMKKVEQRTEDTNHLFRGEVTSQLFLLTDGVDSLKERGAQNHDSLARLEGRVDAIDERVTDHARRNREWIEELRLEVERRIRENQGATHDAFTRAETFRAALHELGIDANPPTLPHPDAPEEQP